MGKVSKKTRFQNLPDEIIIIILSCIPAEILMRFKLVCKNWRDLIESSDFVTCHVKKNSCFPTVFASTLWHKFRTLDNWWEFSPVKELKVRMVRHYWGIFDRMHYLQFSHGGLVVLKDNMYCLTYFILNPLRPSHEHVRVCLSFQLWRSRINGIYFHPSLNEYCSLWKIIVSDGGRIPLVNVRIKSIHYKVLTLGLNPSLKTIIYPFPDRDEAEDGPPPLLRNNYLYWLLEPEKGKSKAHNDIMRFDIVKEEFIIIPCPVPAVLNFSSSKYRTYVQNIDGILSFILFVPSKISIWRLEDDAQQHLWSTASEYTLNIPPDEDSSDDDFEDDVYHDDFPFYHPAGIIAVVGRKLFLKSSKKLFVCDLTHGTTEDYPEKNIYTFCLSHQMSLTSLSKCKPNISVWQNGKEEVVVTAGPIGQASYVRSHW